MIDTHAHISDRFCDVSVEETVGSIKKSKLNKVILVASNVEESADNVKLAGEYGRLLFACVGIHPQDTNPENKVSIGKQINLLDDLIKNNNQYIVAIGECGLDDSPPPPPERERGKKEQEELFRGQIELAEKYNMPLVIHARKAVDEVITILSEYKNLKGVFHCYAGGKKRINKVLELGEDWYFGIDGNVTYESGLGEVVAAIPKNRLVLETDSPFLTPEPFRDQVNKPEYVEFVYRKVAEIWKMKFSETEKIVDKNACKLFGF